MREGRPRFSLSLTAVARPAGLALVLEVAEEDVVEEQPRAVGPRPPELAAHLIGPRVHLHEDGEHGEELEQRSEPNISAPF